jgi:DNA-binding transcriptional LysR family regulator
MDLELLRTFLEVEHSRHFGQAGKVLHLTQAAVSARIKLLESQLGVKLFIRQRGNIRLTPEGHRLVRHADRIIYAWRQARQEVAAEGVKEQLVIGGSLRLWDVLLQDWLHALRRNYPQLAIIAESHTPNLLVRRLLDGLIDVAFMSEPPQLELIKTEQVAIIDLHMVSSQNNLEVSSALESNYIMVDWGLAYALQHRQLFPDAPEPLLRVGQAKIAFEHMLALGGVAYLPLRMIKHHVENKKLFLVQKAPKIRRNAYAVYPVRGLRNELIEDVLKQFQYKVVLDNKMAH